MGMPPLRGLIAKLSWSAHSWHGWASPGADLPRTSARQPNNEGWVNAATIPAALIAQRSGPPQMPGVAPLGAGRIRDPVGVASQRPWAPVAASDQSRNRSVGKPRLLRNLLASTRVGLIRWGHGGCGADP